MWINWLDDHPDQKHQLLNHADENGMTAAHYAAQSNYTEIMEVLIESSGAGEVEVLQICVFTYPAEFELDKVFTGSRGIFFYVHCFLQHAECDFCVRNKESLTPLHLACLNGNVHIVDLIMRKVSDDNKAAVLSAEGRNYYSSLFYCFNSMMSFPFPCPKYIRYSSSNTSTLCC